MWGVEPAVVTLLLRDRSDPNCTAKLNSRTKQLKFCRKALPSVVYLASNFAPAEGGGGIRAGDAEGELVAGGHGGGDALNQLMIIGSLSFLTGL